MNHEKIQELLISLGKAGVCEKGVTIVTELMKEVGFIPPVELKPEEDHFYLFTGMKGAPIRRDFGAVRIFHGGRLCRMNATPIVVEHKDVLRYFTRGEYIDLGTNQRLALEKVANAPLPS